MNRDPVSGNAIPPGATAREVRDDVPIMASENEYIVPANVVRFLGLDKLEKMVSQAQAKLGEMEEQGRVGGDISPAPDDELPFSPEELQMVDSPDEMIPKMAEGGMVGAYQDPNQEIDPKTGLPVWLVQLQNAPTPTVTPPPVTPTAPSRTLQTEMPRASGSTTDRRQGQSNELTGTAQSVAKWTPAEFNKYARTRDSTDQAVGRAAVSMIPLANVGAGMRNRYLDRAVPRGFDSMLETGKDLQGNTLSNDDLAELRESYSKVKDAPKRGRSGLMDAARGMAQDSGLIKRRERKREDTERSGGFRIRDLFKRSDKDKPLVGSRPSEKQSSPVTKSTKSGKQAPPAPTKLSGPKDKSSKKDDKKK